MKEKYQTGEYSLDQIKFEVLLIIEILYLEYELLFIFDNAINHVIYVKDILQVIYINKKLGKQQRFLRLSQYKTPNGEISILDIYLLSENFTINKLTKVQKEI